MGATCIVLTKRNSCKFLSESDKKIGYGYLKNSGELSGAILALLLNYYFERFERNISLV